MPFDTAPLDPLLRQTEIFRQRREDAAALWRSIPRHRFDMALWDCETTACALGWLAHKKHDGWRWTGGDFRNHSPTINGGTSFRTAAEYFGLSVEQSNYVFGFNNYSRTLTPASVGKVLLECSYPH